MGRAAPARHVPGMTAAIETPHRLDRTLRLMIVDDSAKVRAALVIMLADQPGLVVVATASSAEEALRLAPEARVDVVLLDVRMPGMGGLAAVAELKRCQPPPVVLLLSLLDDLSLRRAAERAGADGVLAKTELDAARLREILIDAPRGPMPKGQHGRSR
jgi:DNA-binding NarL/FixJ family response regulator